MVWSFFVYVKNEVTRGNQRSKTGFYKKCCHTYSFEDIRKHSRQKVKKNDFSNDLLSQNFDIFNFNPLK